MSQSPATNHSPSENEKRVSTPEKGAMPNPGNKSALPASRTRTPTHIPRSANNGDSANPSVEDGSSGNKVQSAAARRSSTKSSVSPLSPRRPSSGMSTGTRRIEKVDNVYAMKKKRYQILRKELVDKQKTAQELFNEMSQLREKVISSGSKDPGKIEDLKLEVGSPRPNLAFPPADSTNSSPTVIENVIIGDDFYENLQCQLREIPKKSQNLCRELLKKHLAFLEFLTSRLIKPNSEEPEAEPITNLEEMAIQLQDYQKDHDILQVYVKEVEANETKAIADLLEKTRAILTEYENNRTRQKELNAMEATKELQEQLTSTAEELQAERDKGTQGKDRMRQLQTQLQRAHTKIRELESHVANEEGKVQQLQANMKGLEGQLKQKDQAMDLKMKDMQKTMKNSEGLVNKVEKQRDSFETRLVELKEKMNSKESEALGRIKDLSEKLNVISVEFKDEREKRQQAEEALGELDERYKHLEEKSNQLCELAEKNKDFVITEGSHSDNEVQLFNELQETRTELEMQRNMVLQLQQEKEEIVAVMHQAASHEANEDIKKKLAAELVIRNTELKEQMTQYAELKKIAKNAQEKSGILERQLVEIQSRLHSQLKEGGKVGLNAHAIELQQQLSDLRNELTNVIQQKEELETVLTQKQLELEQRDREMRKQNKVLKVRNELLNMLKGKVEQENDENTEYLEQLAMKTEAIQELNATLESKQLQIMRLEKMVKLMEDQQDRAQAQRTRLENRIADLQHELQKAKEQRGKGFSIL